MSRPTGAPGSESPGARLIRKATAATEDECGWRSALAEAVVEDVERRKRQIADERYHRWTDHVRQGAGAVCAKGVLHNDILCSVVLAWLRDVMAVLNALSIGQVMGDFRGPLGGAGVYA